MSSVATAIAGNIEERRADIARLCSQYSVRRLELFGSAAKGTFDPSRSDFDFLVEFAQSPDLKLFEQYFGFKEALESLLGRPVDLVTEGARQNPYFMQSANESRRLLYAA
jgi:hypothetical protein